MIRVRDKKVITDSLYILISLQSSIFTYNLNKVYPEYNRFVIGNLIKQKERRNATGVVLFTKAGCSSKTQQNKVDSLYTSDDSTGWIELKDMNHKKAYPQVDKLLNTILDNALGKVITTYKS